MTRRKLREVTPTENSRDYLIIAYCDDGIHIYRLRSGGGRNQALRRFDAIAEDEGWQGIRNVEIIGLNTDEELTSLVVLGTERKQV